MNGFQKIRIRNALLLVAALFVLMGFKPDGKITKDEAIKLAEEFIRANGNTTLMPKAFCITEGDRWGIGFLYTRVNLQKLDSLQLQSDLPGRAVIVSLDGKEVRIAHKDPLFSHFKKL